MDRSNKGTEAPLGALVEFRSLGYRHRLPGASSRQRVGRRALEKLRLDAGDDDTGGSGGSGDVSAGASRGGRSGTAGECSKVGGRSVDGGGRPSEDTLGEGLGGSSGGSSVGDVSGGHGCRV